MFSSKNQLLNNQEYVVTSKTYLSLSVVICRKVFEYFSEEYTLCALVFTVSMRIILSKIGRRVPILVCQFATRSSKEWYQFT